MNKINRNYSAIRLPYMVRLFENDKAMGTFRVGKETYSTIKKMLKPYRSMPCGRKAVRCVETGMTFSCAKEAMIWLIEQGKTKSCYSEATVKLVCNKQKETAYGMHWEFI